MEGNDQTTCDCQEGPEGVVQHLVIDMIVLGKMLQVEERCQAESGNQKQPTAMGTQLAGTSKVLC